MATITSDTFLDGGTARTANETWTINGGVLTVRTDTRWHANAPAAMTGSLGSITVSATLGGGVLLDARNVRWLAFNSGLGTVPAIGTTITQGAVSGYFLGVWANLTSAPTAVGAAMPATGFIKFREVTGGVFAAGALTGITANADGADVVGWIEVVQRQSSANIIPRLGFFRTRGDWFEVGTTSGSAGQIIQIPTNGGGAGTSIPGVQIETGVGTGVYEWFPAVHSGFVLTNISTDVRGKLVQSIGSGQVRIGNDGTTNVMFTPVAGCRIRVPNIFLRQCTTSDAVNQVPNSTLGTRPDFTTTSGGVIDIEHTLGDWYLAFSAPYSFNYKHSAAWDLLSLTNVATRCTIDNIAQSPYIAGATLAIASCFFGGDLINAKFIRGDAGTNGHVGTLNFSALWDFDNVHLGVVTFARSTGRSLNVNQSFDCTFNDLYQYNAYMAFITSYDCTVTNIDHCDRFIGDTNATTGMYVISTTASCDNIMVDGITYGVKGASSAFNNPYLGLVNAANSTNITFRNGGTSASPLISNPSNAPASIYVDGGANAGVRIQRIFCNVIRTALLTTANTSTRQVMQDCVGSVGALTVASLESIVKGCRTASFSATGQASVYGTHFHDLYFTNTTGAIRFDFNEPTLNTASSVSLTLASAAGGFTSAGNVAMPAVGDQIIMEYPYFVIGYTAFENTAATITGTNTGNFTYEYQIDTGSGFGAYQTLNATNLSAETISPSTGFKLRIRITCTVANTGNLLTYLRIPMTTTLVAQQGNLYLLDEIIPVNITATVLANSRVQLYNVTQNTEIDNVFLTGTSYVYTVTGSEIVEGDTVRLRVTKLGYSPVNSVASHSSAGIGYVINQTLDEAYTAYAIDGSTVTKFTADYIDTEVDLTVATNFSGAEFYAWYNYNLTTEQGIRNFFGAVTAIDSGNIRINTSVVDVQFDNLTSTNVFQDDNIRIFRSDSAYPVKNPTTGGGGIDLVWRNQVYVVSTGGSALTPTESSWLSSINVITAKVDGLIEDSAGNRFTAKALETAPNAAGVSEADIYTYFTTSSRENAFKADVSAIPTNPLLTTDTRLNNLDATISSRATPASLSTIDGKIDTLDTKVDLIDSNMDIINDGIKNASKLIPHSTNLA